MTARLATVTAALAWSAMGCGGKTLTEISLDSSVDSIVEPPVDASLMPEASACPSEPVSADAVAATPRSDPELELLAILLGTSLVADGATYERVVRDVGAIRAKNPAVAGLHVPRPYEQRVRIVAEPATAKAMQAKSYHAWDCQNAFWGATANDGTSGSTELTFKGLYAIDGLACLYLSLPGVLQVQSVGPLFGDGPALFAWSEADTLHYAFDLAGGDCPSGCTTHHVWHYATTVGGAITLVEEIDDSTGGAPVLPAWWSHRYPKLNKCLRL